MQVSGHFLHLDKSIEQASAPYYSGLLAQRPLCAGQTARISGAVLPPVTGGLHCGTIATFSGGDVTRCSRR